MCGIVGILGRPAVAPLLLEALQRLEYRGYDSAGIATLIDGGIERRRAEGKLGNLKRAVEAAPLAGRTGIGHTRWATHGAPTHNNAHPHEAGGVAVVHNGIIENFAELRAELIRRGHEFHTQTDTEVVPQLVSANLAKGMDPAAAAAAALGRFEGAFALVLLFAGHEDLLICARRGSPLAIGYGDGEMYVGSDALGLAHLTDRIQYLEEGDWAVITPEGATIRGADGEVVERAIAQTAFSGALIGKGNYRHFMHKEIHEQPAVLGDTLRAFASPADHRITLPDLPIDFEALSRLVMVACGTASYACMVAKYWFEQLAGLPVDLDIGSEFRYRSPPLTAGGAALFVSQSGETMDTLEAMRAVKAEGLATIAVVNVPESTLAREADCQLRTLAGPEIGVASTKAFTTQLATLACLAIGVGRARRRLSSAREAELTQALDEVPARAAEVLVHDARYEEIAHELSHARDVLYLGRGTSFAIALEGALKLKEISYIHAEAYAAGELKHGPLALVDENMPVVAVAPDDDLLEKLKSNLHEVDARGGELYVFADPRVQFGDRVGIKTMHMPATIEDFQAPILYTIPLQLLAYHVAVQRGTDVDQPRNLAKSVTVE